MPEERLRDLAGFRDAISTLPRVLLFKHSPICPVSTRALAEWEAFQAAHPEAQTLYVDVIAERATARGLAELCGIVHASPQAILFVDGEPRWDASHGGITAESLARAWSR